jgi:hypothetical protein
MFKNKDPFLPQQLELHIWHYNASYISSLGHLDADALRRNELPKRIPAISQKATSRLEEFSPSFKYKSLIIRSLSIAWARPFSRLRLSPWRSTSQCRGSASACQ